MFFKSKPKKIEKSIGAILYPEQVIIATKNKKDEFTWYQTDEFSVLPVNATDQVIGEAMIKHLDDSAQTDVTQEQIRIYWNRFKKLSKLKTEKAVFEKAKYASVYLIDHQLRFEPFKTKVQQRLFYRLPDNIFSTEFSSNITDVGSNLRKAWSFCTFE